MKKRIFLSLFIALFTTILFCTCYKEITHTVTIHFASVGQSVIENGMITYPNNDPYWENNKRLSNSVKITVLPSQSLYEAVKGMPPEIWPEQVAKWQKDDKKQPIVWTKNDLTGDYGFISWNPELPEKKENIYSANWSDELRFTVDHIHNDETVGIFDEIYDVKDLYVLYKGPLETVNVDFCFNRSSYNGGNPTYENLNGIIDYGIDDPNVADGVSFNDAIRMHCYRTMPIAYTPETIKDYKTDEAGRYIVDSSGKYEIEVDEFGNKREWVKNDLITSYSRDKYTSRSLVDYGFQKWIGHNDPFDLNGVYYSFIDERHKKGLTDEDIYNSTAGQYAFVCINEPYDSSNPQAGMADKYSGQIFITNDSSYPLPDIDDGSTLKLMPVYLKPTETVRYFYFNDYRLNEDPDYYNHDISIEYRAGKKLKSPFDIYKSLYGWYDEATNTPHQASYYSFEREKDSDPDGLFAEEWYLKWVTDPDNTTDRNWVTLSTTEETDNRYPSRKKAPSCSTKTNSPNFGYIDITRVVPETEDYYQYNYRAARLIKDEESGREWPVYLFDETDEKGIPIPGKEATIFSAYPVTGSKCIRPSYTEAGMFRLVFHYTVNDGDGYREVTKDVVVNSSNFNTFPFSPTVEKDSKLKVDVLEDMKLAFDDDGVHNKWDSTSLSVEDDSEGNPITIKYGYRKYIDDYTGANPDVESPGTMYYFYNPEFKYKENEGDSDVPVPNKDYYEFLYQDPDGNTHAVGYGDNIDSLFEMFELADVDIIEFTPNYTTKKIKIEIGHNKTNTPDENNIYDFDTPEDQKSYVEIIQGEKFGTASAKDGTKKAKDTEIKDWDFGQGEYETDDPNNPGTYVKWEKDKPIYTDSYGYVDKDNDDELWQFYDKSKFEDPLNENDDDLENKKLYWFELEIEDGDEVPYHPDLDPDNDNPIYVSTEDYFLTPVTMKPKYTPDEAECNIHFYITEKDGYDEFGPKFKKTLKSIKINVPKGSMLTLDPSKLNEDTINNKVNLWYIAETDGIWPMDVDPVAKSYNSSGIDFTDELKYGYRDPDDNYRRWYFGEDDIYSPNSSHEQYSYIVYIDGKNQNNEAYYNKNPDAQHTSVFTDTAGNVIADAQNYGKIHVPNYTKKAENPGDPDDMKYNYVIRDKKIDIWPDYKYVDDNGISIYDGGYAATRTYFRTPETTNAGRDYEDDAFNSKFSMNFVYVPGTTQAWPSLLYSSNDGLYNDMITDLLTVLEDDKSQGANGLSPFYIDKSTPLTTSFDDVFTSKRIDDLLVAENTVSKKFFAYSLARYVDLMFFGGNMKDSDYDNKLLSLYPTDENSPYYGDRLAVIRYLLKNAFNTRNNNPYTANICNSFVANTSNDLAKMGITLNTNDVRIFDREGDKYKYPVFVFHENTLHNGYNSSDYDDIVVDGAIQEHVITTANSLSNFNTDDLGITGISLCDSLAFCNLLTTIYNCTHEDDKLSYVYLDKSVNEDPKRRHYTKNVTAGLPFSGIYDATLDITTADIVQAITFNSNNDIEITDGTGFRLLSYEEKDYTDRIITNEMLVVKNGNLDSKYFINNYIYNKIKYNDILNHNNAQVKAITQDITRFYKRGKPYVCQGLKKTDEGTQKIVLESPDKVLNYSTIETGHGTSFFEGDDAIFKKQIYHRGGANLFDQNGYTNSKIPISFTSGTGADSLTYYVTLTDNTSAKSIADFYLSALNTTGERQGYFSMGRVCRKAPQKNTP